MQALNSQFICAASTYMRFSFYLYQQLPFVVVVVPGDHLNSLGFLFISFFFGSVLLVDKLFSGRLTFPRLLCGLGP